MPLTRLMRQLSTRLDKRPSAGSGPISAMTSDTRTSREDELLNGSAPPCFVVTAEIRPLSRGERSACSSSLSSSGGSSTGAPEHDEPAVASSVPVGHHMANARVLRARNKAAHRGEALGAASTGGGHDLAAGTSARPSSLPSAALLDRLPQQLRTLKSGCSSCSSMDALTQQQQLLEQQQHGAAPYHRAATAPLPLAAVPAGSSSWAAAAGARAQQRPQVPDGDDCGSDDGSELASPVAPAGFDQLAADDGEHHCEWEDGVVASWLQGLDHPDLDDLHDDHHEQHEGGAAAAAAEHGRPGALPFGSPPQRSLSAMSVGTPAAGPSMVYSSSLYG